MQLHTKQRQSECKLTELVVTIDRVNRFTKSVWRLLFPTSNRSGFYKSTMNFTPEIQIDRHRCG